MRLGLALIAVGVAILPLWFVVTDWLNPNPTGLEIKDGAVPSAIPSLAALVLVVWGIVRVTKALLARWREGPAE